jgi:hypothetical protein
MAVATFEIDDWAGGALADWLHVNGMIYLHRPGVARAFSQSSELRVTIFETMDVRRESQPTTSGLQICMASSAALVTGGFDVYAAAMFHMACRTFERLRLTGVMDGAVMTREAGTVRGFCGECAGLLDMTSGASLFEDGVSYRHASARVHAVITRKTAPRYPNQGK